MKKPLSSRRISIAAYWPELLFLLSFAATILTTFYVSKNIIDSDASSELVLSHYLAHSSDFLLTKDWFYSTELRVLNTQLVYSTLFRFFSDWSFVRFGSAMILQMILLISYGFLLHQAGFGKKEFFLGSALLLLPVSVTYGRIVLYHCYYIPHLALSFFLLGLTLRYTGPTNWKTGRPWFRLAVLMLFSFLGGLGGVRQLMVTHAPLLLCIVALCFLEDSRQEDCKISSFLRPGNVRFIIISVLSALCSLIGLKVNTGILGKSYSFQLQSDMQLGLLNSDALDNMVYGFFHHFGFRDRLPLLSLMGILSAAGVFAGGYCIFLSVRRFLAHGQSRDLKKSILLVFSLSVTAVTLLLFVLTGKYGGYHYVLYLVFALPWAILLFSSELIQLPKDMHILRSGKLLPIIAVLVLLANGWVNVLYFNGNQNFSQVYEGLSFQEIDKKDTMSDVSDFLLENGYDIGYATFWNGNILTEITDGRIRMINVDLFPNIRNGSIIYSNWLSLFSIRETDAEKPFILMEVSEMNTFSNTEAYQHCSLAYSDDRYCVLDLLQEDAVKDILNTDIWSSQ